MRKQYKVIKKYTFLFVFWMLSIFAYGQDLKQWLESNDKYVPVSPNAASLGMYGSIPVGHYTGIPYINIPLYEINLDGKKFPIGLSYHASGIKVAQDASWVGLGWALNIGGTITRQVMGWDDFNQSEGGYYYDPNLPMDTDEIELTSVDLSYAVNEKWGYYLSNIRDPEPDLFQFNFGNHSGSFYFDKSGKNGNTYSEAKAELINKNEYLNIVFKVSDKAGTFTITDGDGFIYYFGTTEKSKILSSSSSSFVSNYRELGTYSERKRQPEVITSWMLDSIVSPNNNKISFEYGSEKIWTIPTMSEDVSVRMPYYYALDNNVALLKS